MVNVPTASRVSLQQLKLLAKCMEQFPSLALANRSKIREEITYAHKKWLQIGSALNKIKPGITKTGLGWLKYWSSYKCLLRRRYPQFKSSWVSDDPVQGNPFEHHIIEILANHEKSHLRLVKIQSRPTKQKMSQPVPTTQVDVCKDMKPLSPAQDDDYDDDNNTLEEDSNSTEDPIGTVNEIKEETQIEILKFNLKRQREMHELEITQMKEKHRLMIEILQIKKKKLMQDCDRMSSSVIS